MPKETFYFLSVGLTLFRGLVGNDGPAGPRGGVGIAGSVRVNFPLAALAGAKQCPPRP